MYYRKSRHNFFRNIFNNKMTKYYFLILLVLAVLIGFTLSYVIEHYNEPKSNSNQSESTTPSVIENNSTNSDNTEKESVSESETLPEVKYKIRINQATNRVYIYENDTIVKCFICSASTNLIVTDNYMVSDKYVWHPIENNNYSQYATKINNNTVIESIPFIGADNSKMMRNYYFNLGKNVEDKDRVYMLVGDAMWIYNNCTKNTPVSIYSDPNEQISISPERIPELLWCITWDPTDSSVNNVWSKTPVSHFTGISDKIIPLGSNWDPLAEVNAYDINGNSIKSKIVLDNTLDVTRPGIYAVTYVIVDIYGGNQVWQANITVLDNNKETQAPSE